MFFSHFFYISLPIIICDYLSKKSVLNFFLVDNTPSLTFSPFLKFNLVWNRGISFGMLQNITNINVIMIIIAIILVVMLFFWSKIERGSNLFNIGCYILIGGAIGNLLDRFLYGAVVDFIVLHYENLYWPAFNLADSANFVGVSLMFISGLKKDISSS